MQTILAICALLAATLQTCAAETVQLEDHYGTYMVPVHINGAVTLPFVLDTGASAVAIPEDLFSVLTRTGTVTTSDFLGTGTVQLADGSEHASRRFVLHEVQVGNHVVRNVIANVVSVRGDPLLGQSFLSKLPAWAIDNQRHTLVLNDPGSIGPPQDVPVAPPVAPRTGAPASLNNKPPKAEWVQADSALIPGNIQDQIKSELKGCNNPKITNKFIKYNKNPHYFVIDYGEVSCDGHHNYYCGSAGCSIQVFVMRPSGEYEKVLDDLVRGLKFVQVSGRPAMSITLHGIACDLPGNEVCLKTVGLGPTR